MPALKPKRCFAAKNSPAIWAPDIHQENGAPFYANTLDVLLTQAFETYPDACILPYICSPPRRLGVADADDPSVQIAWVPIDLDSPSKGHSELRGTPMHLEWQAHQLELAEAFLPAPAVWESPSGGLRLLWAAAPGSVTPLDYNVRCEAFLQELAAFGFAGIDPTTAQWVRHQRLPRGGDVLGEPGVLTLPPVPDGVEVSRPMAFRDPTSEVVDTILFRMFEAAHMPIGDVYGDKARVCCPWDTEHSDSNAPGYDPLSGRAVIMADVQGKGMGVFKCAHGHCAHRGNADVLKLLAAASPEAARVLAEHDDRGRVLSDSLLGSAGTRPTKPAAPTLAVAVSRADVRVDGHALRDLGGSYRDKLKAQKKLLLSTAADGHAINEGAMPMLAKLLHEGFPDVSTDSLVGALRMSFSHGDVEALSDGLRRRIDELRVVRAEVQQVGLQQSILDMLAPMDLAFNELSGQPEINGNACTDEHIVRLRLACEHYGLGAPDKPIGKVIIEGCVLIESKKHAYHPVRDYLRSVKWDSVERNLATYLGADVVIQELGADEENKHEEMKMSESTRTYQLTVCQLWLRSAVARIMQPGCKVDTVLILEGPQGAKKSTAARVLISDAWSYEASTGEIGNKDFAVDMQGKWAAEIPEIDRLISSKDESTLKAVTSKVSDRYRAPFDRHSMDHPRQMVFIGTTNRDDYLRDETGNRRYWPVRCGTIDLEGLRQDRDQLWAQAVHEYDRGDAWWLDAFVSATAIAEQAARLEQDIWLEPMRRADLPERFTTDEALDEIPGSIPVCDRNQQHQARMGRVLRALGYEKKPLWRGGIKQKLWRKT